MMQEAAVNIKAFPCFTLKPHPPNGSRIWSSITCLMERRVGVNSGFLQFLSKQANQREKISSWRRGWAGKRWGLHNATNGGWGLGGGEEGRRSRGQSWKCILSEEGREWNGRWKRRQERGEGGGRMEGSRGVSEGEKESRVGVAASPLDCYWFSVSLRVHQLFLSISCTSFLPMPPLPNTHALLRHPPSLHHHPSPATNLFRYLPACFTPVYSCRFIY